VHTALKLKQATVLQLLAAVLLVTAAYVMKCLANVPKSYLARQDALYVV
jgi:hypothetical protein